MSTKKLVLMLRLISQRQSVQLSEGASALKMKAWNGRKQGKIALFWEQCSSEKMVKRCPERSSILIQQGQTVQRELAFHGVLGKGKENFLNRVYC